jgi:hypothetical protein
MPGIDPVSLVIQLWSSSAFSSMSEPARRSTAARSSKLVAAQSRCASAAVAAALATSSASATPARPSSFPVAGSTIGASPPCERTQPPLNTWPSHVLGSSNVMSWSPVGSVIGWHMMRSEIARRFSRGT